MQLTINVPGEFVTACNQILDTLQIPRERLPDVLGDYLAASGVAEDTCLVVSNHVFSDRAAAERAASAYFDEAFGEPSQHVSYFNRIGEVLTDEFENPLRDEMPQVLALLHGLEGAEIEEESA